MDDRKVYLAFTTHDAMYRIVFAKHNVGAIFTSHLPFSREDAARWVERRWSALEQGGYLVMMSTDISQLKLVVDIIENTVPRVEVSRFSIVFLTME